MDSSGKICEFYLQEDFCLDPTEASSDQSEGSTGDDWRGSFLNSPIFTGERHSFNHESDRYVPVKDKPKAMESSRKKAQVPTGSGRALHQRDHPNALRTLNHQHLVDKKALPPAHTSGQNCAQNSKVRQLQVQGATSLTHQGNDTRNRLLQHRGILGKEKQHRQGSSAQRKNEGVTSHADRGESSLDNPRFPTEHTPPIDQYNHKKPEAFSSYSAILRRPENNSTNNKAEDLSSLSKDLEQIENMISGIVTGNEGSSHQQETSPWHVADKWWHQVSDDNLNDGTILFRTKKYVYQDDSRQHSKTSKSIPSSKVASLQSKNSPLKRYLNKNRHTFAEKKESLATETGHNQYGRGKDMQQSEINPTFQQKLLSPVGNPEESHSMDKARSLQGGAQRIIKKIVEVDKDPHRSVGSNVLPGRVRSAPSAFLCERRNNVREGRSIGTENSRALSGCHAKSWNSTTQADGGGSKVVQSLKAHLSVQNAKVYFQPRRMRGVFPRQNQNQTHALQCHRNCDNERAKTLSESDCIHHRSLSATLKVEKSSGTRANPKKEHSTGHDQNSSLYACSPNKSQESEGWWWGQEEGLEFWEGSVPGIHDSGRSDGGEANTSDSSNLAEEWDKEFKIEKKQACRQDQQQQLPNSQTGSKNWRPVSGFSSPHSLSFSSSKKDSSGKAISRPVAGETPRKTAIIGGGPVLLKKKLCHSQQRPQKSKQGTKADPVKLYHEMQARRSMQDKKKKYNYT